MSRPSDRLRKKGEGLLTFGQIYDGSAVSGLEARGLNDPLDAAPRRCSEWVEPSERQRPPLPGASRWLPVSSVNASRFDSLRDLSLKYEEDEAQAIPGLKLRVRERVAREQPSLFTEPEAWHPASPSRMWERSSTNLGFRSAADAFSFERMQATGPSETRILGGSTEQLTVPFERVPATSEKFVHHTSAATLPYTGLWHDEVTFASKAEALGAQEVESLAKAPPKRAAETALLRSQASKACPRAARVLLEKLRRETTEDLSAAGVAADLQERAVHLAKQPLSADEQVENLLLAAVQPGLAPGVAEKSDEEEERCREQGRLAAEARAKAVAMFWESRRRGGDGRRTQSGGATGGRGDEFQRKNGRPSRFKAEGELVLQRHDATARMLLGDIVGLDRMETFPSEKGAPAFFRNVEDPTGVSVEEAADVPKETHAENLIARLEVRLGVGGDSWRDKEIRGRAQQMQRLRATHGRLLPRASKDDAAVPDGEFLTHEDAEKVAVRGVSVPDISRAVRLVANLERDQEKEADVLAALPKRIAARKATPDEERKSEPSTESTEAPQAPSGESVSFRVISKKDPSKTSAPSGSPGGDGEPHRGSILSTFGKAFAPAAAVVQMLAAPLKAAPGLPPAKSGVNDQVARSPKELAFQKSTAHAASGPSAEPAEPTPVAPKRRVFLLSKKPPEDPKPPSDGPETGARGKETGDAGAGGTGGARPGDLDDDSEDEEEEAEAELPLLFPRSEEKSFALASWNAVEAIRQTYFPPTVHRQPIYDKVGRVILPKFPAADGDRVCGGDPAQQADRDEDDLGSAEDPEVLATVAGAPLQVVYDNPPYKGKSYEVMDEYQPDLDTDARPVGPGAASLIYAPTRAGLPTASPGKRGEKRGAAGVRRRGREERTLLPRPKDFTPVTRYPHDDRSRASLAFLGVSEEEGTSSGVSRLANCEGDLTTAPSATGVLEMLGEKRKGGKPLAKAAVRPVLLGEAEGQIQSLDALKQVECVVDGGYRFLQLEEKLGDDAEAARHRPGSSLWQQHATRKRRKKYEFTNSFGDLVVAPFLSRAFVPVRLQDRDAAFLKNEETLLARYAYPEGQFSPGYYVKEEDIENRRRKVLETKRENMSVFDFQERMKQEQLAKAREEAERLAREQSELEARLRAETRKAHDDVFRTAGDDLGRQDSGGSDQPVLRPTALGRKKQRTGRPPKFVELTVPELKDRYRAIKKQNSSDPLLASVVACISKKMGKPKNKVKVQGRHRRRMDPEKKLEDEKTKKKQKILKMLAAQQGGAQAAGLLAQLRGNADEDEEASDEDEDDLESVTTQYTYPSVTLSSYESVQDTFPHFTFNYPRYSPCPLRFPDVRKTPLSHSGLLLVSDDFRSARSATRALATPTPGKKRASGFFHQQMYVEVRDRVIFFFSSGKRSAAMSVASSPRPEEMAQLVPVDADETWSMLFGMCFDVYTEVELMTVQPYALQKAGLQYLAIRVAGSNSNLLPGAAAALSGEGERTAAEERVANDSLIVALLSADSDEETLQWYRLFKRRVAFARYADALSSATGGDQPAQSVAEFCLSGVSTAGLSFKGVPFSASLEGLLFSNLTEEKVLGFLDLSYRNLSDAGVAEIMSMIPFHAEAIDLSCNGIEAQDPLLLCQLANKLHAGSLDVSDNPLGTRASAGVLLFSLLTETPLSRIDMNRCRFGTDAATAFREKLDELQRPMEHPKEVSLSGNELVATDVIALVTNYKSKLPGLLAINVSGNPALTLEEIQAALKASLSKVDMSVLTFLPSQPAVRALSTPIIGGVRTALSLPLTLSGRLYAAGWKRVQDSYVLAHPVKTPAAEHDAVTALSEVHSLLARLNETSLPFVYFELRGPALIWSDLPPRDASWLTVGTPGDSSARQETPRPRCANPMSSARKVSGIVMHRVRVDFDTQPRVMVIEGFDLSGPAGTDDPNADVDLPGLNDRVNLPLTTVSYVLRAQTDAATLEWARICNARLAGIYYVRTEARLQRLVSPSAVRFFEVSGGTCLDFGGYPASPEGLRAIFFFLCKYTRVKSLIMCNMRLSSSHLAALTGEAWRLYDLECVDLSFNDFTSTDSDALATVTSFRSCKRLILDRNPIGDSALFADCFLKLCCYRRVTQLCLNGCGLGTKFAQTAARRLEEVPPDPSLCTLRTVELQSNSIAGGALRDLANCLVNNVPTIETIRAYGNASAVPGVVTPGLVDLRNTFADKPEREGRFGAPAKHRVKKEKKDESAATQMVDDIQAHAALQALLKMGVRNRAGKRGGAAEEAAPAEAADAADTADAGGEGPAGDETQAEEPAADAAAAETDAQADDAEKAAEELESEEATQESGRAAGSSQVEEPTAADSGDQEAAAAEDYEGEKREDDAEE
ncbi:hypothetical protein BESB_068340 [Besnoitia besnoiti]|uniref:Uncharacterized protein n=1 Tax=Besnoitia besnoiti TaxID=94643 RepID=A0A2A9MEW6_BESBE|nr:hypothetical protein BESB_068340 [Besnoitia besnoiti]PFH34801.1 hypothetical protein BESB_068340 [Besnoitia besnoiti]